MARPRKTGLDYFPMDVGFLDSDIIVAVAGRYGSVGVHLLLRVLCSIYRNGFYIRFDELFVLRLTKEFDGLEEDKVRGMICDLVKWGFFDAVMFDNNGVLTSVTIQNQYFNVVNRNRIKGEDMAYLLAENPGFSAENPSFSAENPEKTGVFDGFSTENSEKRGVFSEKPAENATKKRKEKKREEKVNNTFSDEKDIDISSGDASISSSSPSPDEAVAESRKSKLDDVRRADGIIDLYNRRIAETGCRLRSCVAKSEKRRGMVLARLREHGEEKVRAVIEKAVASRFLNYSARAAPMDIEWIFGRDNFPKVLEGKYDNEKSNNQSNGDTGNNKDDEWRDRSEMDIRLGRRMGKGGYVSTI